MERVHDYKYPREEGLGDIGTYENAGSVIDRLSWWRCDWRIGH